MRPFFRNLLGSARFHLARISGGPRITVQVTPEANLASHRHAGSCIPVTVDMLAETRYMKAPISTIDTMVCPPGVSEDPTQLELIALQSAIVLRQAKEFPPCPVKVVFPARTAYYTMKD